MTVYSFGTPVNPAHYVEVDDGVSNPPKRPASSLSLIVRDNNSLAALPPVTVDAGTGYFNFTTTDVPVVQVSADSGVNWIPLIGIEAEISAATGSSTADSAYAVASAVQADLTALLDSVGQPGGLATLDTDGSLESIQAAGISPQLQNLDGTWNPRPATPRPIFWWRRVGGSAAPDTNGTTAGGAGMVDGFDVIVDVAADLGT